MLTSKACSAELVMIISYSESRTRIFVLSNTLQHIIDYLNKKKVKERNAAIEKTETKFHPARFIADTFIDYFG